MSRTWSWRGHLVIVGVVVALAGVLTILLVTRVLDLSAGQGAGIRFSHDDLAGDFLLLVWASVGAFVIASTGLLAAGLRKGAAVIVPYVVGLGAIPATWMLLDKLV